MYIGLGFQLINIILIVGFLGISIYLLVLTIKLMHRGIKVLDIYIQEKSNS